MWIIYYSWLLLSISTTFRCRGKIDYVLQDEVYGGKAKARLVKQVLHVSSALLAYYAKSAKWLFPKIVLQVIVPFIWFIDVWSLTFLKEWYQCVWLTTNRRMPHFELLPSCWFWLRWAILILSPFQDTMTLTWWEWFSKGLTRSGWSTRPRNSQEKFSKFWMNWSEMKTRLKASKNMGWFR